MFHVRLVGCKQFFITFFFLPFDFLIDDGDDVIPTHFIPPALTAALFQLPSVLGILWGFQLLFSVHCTFNDLSFICLQRHQI